MSLIKDLGGFSQLGGDAGFQIFGANGGGSGNTSDYDSDAIAIFNAMVPTPSDARKTLINNFVVGCKNDVSLTGNTSNWVECDTIRVRAAASEQASFLNWKSPALYISTILGSPVFVTDRYWESNGVGVLNNNWSSANAVKYTLNNASFGIYILNEVNSLPMIGFVDNSVGVRRNYIYPRDGGSFYSAINSDTDSIYVIASSVGYFGVRRVNATTQHAVVNGVDVTSDAIASTSLSLLDFYELGVNVDGTPGIGSARSGASHTGSGYVDQVKLAARFATYLTAVGAL